MILLAGEYFTFIIILVLDSKCGRAPEEDDLNFLTQIEFFNQSGSDHLWLALKD